MTITLAHSGIDPSAGSIAPVEDIIEVQTKDNLLKESIPPDSSLLSTYS